MPGLGRPDELEGSPKQEGREEEPCRSEQEENGQREGRLQRKMDLTHILSPEGGRVSVYSILVV